MDEDRAKCELQDVLGLRELAAELPYSTQEIASALDFYRGNTTIVMELGRMGFETIPRLSLDQDIRSTLIDADIRRKFEAALANRENRPPDLPEPIRLNRRQRRAAQAKNRHKEARR